MPDADEIVRLQALLADALLQADPVAFLRRAEDHAAHLRAIDADGLRIAALLVAKLRFERLMNGSREARAWFERDGPRFTAAFRRYHLAQPPHACDPWAEADSFRAWCAAHALQPPE